jgi:hypothetical protein
LILTPSIWPCCLRDCMHPQAFSEVILLICKRVPRELETLIDYSMGICLNCNLLLR